MVETATPYAPALEGTTYERYVDGVFVVEKTGHVVACNQRFLELTNFERRALVGQSCNTFLDPRQRDGFANYIRAAFAGPAQRVAVRGRSASGATLFLEVTLTLDASGEQLIGIARDATQTYDFLDVPHPATINLSASRLARFSGWSIDVATGETTWGQEIPAFLRDAGGDAPDDRANLETFFEGHDRDVVGAALDECVHHGTAFDVQCAVRDVNGERLDTRVIAEAIVDANGRVTRVEGALYDITDLVRRSQSANENERELLETLERVTLPLYFVGRDWTFHYVNRAGLELAHLDEHALRSKTIWEFFPEIQFNSFFDTFHAAMDEGRFGTAVEHLDALDGDFEEVVHPTPQGIVITVRNVTAERNTKRQLSEIEETANTLTKMLDFTKDAVIVNSFRDGVTYWNHGAEALYGWTFAEIGGTSPIDFLYPDPPTARAAVEIARRDGFWSGEMTQQSRDGRRLITESRLSLWRGEDGEPLSLLGVHSDVTVARREHEARVRAQRMESLGTLAGGIAHDLNNVLTPMVLTLELLSTRHGEGRDHELLDALSTSVNRASDMVRQVLTFARGAEGVRTNVSVRHLLVELRHVCENTLPKNIDLDFDEGAIDGAIDGAIWGDETQLLQVLINLVTNARDAMRDGGRLTIRARPSVMRREASDHSSPTLWALVDVSDTGTGMDEATLALIFEPFFTTKDFGEGTGLGLSTSLAIVKSHGGDLVAESALERGTTFTLRLPFDDEATAQLVLDEEPTARTNAHVGHVLVVDDEVAIVDMLAQVLRTSGYQVETTTNAPAALALVEQRLIPFDVILTDVNMPQLSGAQFALRLLELDPTANVIFMSGVSDDELRAVMGDERPLRFLAKPFTISKLLAFVDDALN